MEARQHLVRLLVSGIAVLLESRVPVQLENTETACSRSDAVRCPCKK